MLANARVRASSAVSPFRSLGTLGLSLVAALVAALALPIVGCRSDGSVDHTYSSYSENLAAADRIANAYCEAQEAQCDAATFVFDDCIHDQMHTLCATTSCASAFVGDANAVNSCIAMADGVGCAAPLPGACSGLWE